MLAFTAAVIICYVLRNYLSARLGSSISMDMRARMYEKIQALSIYFSEAAGRAYEQNDSGYSAAQAFYGKHLRHDV